MSFFVVGGTMGNDAVSYVKRTADADLAQCLLAGEFCYVLTSRQMGKSSLMVRTANRLRIEGVGTVTLDLTEIGGGNLNASQWYFGILESLGLSLDLEDELDDFWDANERLGPLQRLMRAISQIILPRLELDEFVTNETKVRLVVFLDEIDIVRSVPFATDEFFAAIRECYNRRSRDPALEALTFCLIGVASPVDLIKDPQTTPFNIGKRIVIDDFSAAESALFCQGFESHGASPEQANELLARVMYWTGGHPYLTQRLSSTVADRMEVALASEAKEIECQALVDEVCQGVFLSSESRDSDDNFIFVRERLLRYEGDVATLLRLYQRIWTGHRVAYDELDPELEALLLAGVVRRVGVFLEVRNRLYHTVFDRQWVAFNLPRSELLRERTERRRRSFAIGSISVIVLLITGIVLFFINRKTVERDVLQIGALVKRTEVGTRSRAKSAVQRAERWSFLSSDRSRLRNVALGALTRPNLEALDPLVWEASVAAALSHDQQRCARVLVDGSVEVVEVGNPENSRQLGVVDATAGVSVSWSLRDGYLTVIATSGTTVFSLTEGPAEWAPSSLQSGHYAVAFSRDEGRVALAKEGRVEVRDLRGRGRSWSMRQNEGEIAVLRFSPDAQFLAAAVVGNKSVPVWSFDAKKRRWEARTPLDLPSAAVDIEWHPSGEELAIASATGRISLCHWQVGPPTEFKTYYGAQGTDLAYSPNGDLLIALCGDSVLRMWRAFDREELVSQQMPGSGQLQVSGDSRNLSVVRASPSGKDIAFERFEIVGLGGRHSLYLPSPNQNWLPRLAFSEFGLLYGVGGADLRVWVLEDPTMSLRLPVTGARDVSSLGVADGVLCMGGLGLLHIPNSLRNDGADSALGFQRPTLHLPTALKAMSCSEAGVSAAISAARNGEDILYLFQSDRPDTAQSTVLDEVVDRIELSRDGRWLAAASSQNSKLAVGSVRPEELRVDWERTLTASRNFSLSPDGDWLATALKGEVRLHRLADPTLAVSAAMTYQTPSDEFVPLSFASVRRGSQDILILAAAVASNQLKVFSVDEHGEAFSELLSLETASDSPFLAIRFSPQGRYLGSVTREGLIQFWDLAHLSKELAGLNLADDLPDFNWRPRLGRPSSLYAGFEASELSQPMALMSTRWKMIEELNSELNQTENPEMRIALLKERAKIYYRMGKTREYAEDEAAAKLLQEALETPMPSGGGKQTDLGQ